MHAPDRGGFIGDMVLRGRGVYLARMATIG